MIDSICSQRRTETARSAQRREVEIKKSAALAKQAETCGAPSVLKTQSMLLHTKINADSFGPDILADPSKPKIFMSQGTEPQTQDPLESLISNLPKLINDVSAAKVLAYPTISMLIKPESLDKLGRLAHLADEKLIESLSHITAGWLLLGVEAEKRQDQTIHNILLCDETSAALSDNPTKSGTSAILANQDVHSFVQYVLRSGYFIQNQSLWEYGQKVRYYNELKRQIRDELTRARACATAWISNELEEIFFKKNFYTGPYLGPNTPFTFEKIETVTEVPTFPEWLSEKTAPNNDRNRQDNFFTDTIERLSKRVTKLTNGSPHCFSSIFERLIEVLSGLSQSNDSPQNVQTQPGEIQSREELNVYIQDLEEKLNSVGDDGQIANVDLQAGLQRQQHTLQTLSNMSKVLHETAMAVMRRIGA